MRATLDEVLTKPINMVKEQMVRSRQMPFGA